MQLLEVRDVIDTGGGTYACTIMVLTEAGDVETLPFTVSPTDPYGLGPAVRTRIEKGQIVGRVYRDR